MINEDNVMDYIEYAGRTNSNRVYPLSIAEGYQSGNILTDKEKQCVMFWHYCGFAYLSGNVTEAFLDMIYRDYFCKETKRRFVLITDDEKVKQYYAGKEGLVMDQRKEYRYSDGMNFSEEEFYTDLKIERIDASNINTIQGRIVPAFSWESDDAFLKNGFGYVAMDGKNFSAIAFSAAVSSEEVDIGVETAQAFRQNGLASYLAFKMCEEIINRNRKPVWAHAEKNVGSQKTAIRAGFKPCRVNTVIRKL